MYSRVGWAWGHGVPQGGGGMSGHPAATLVLPVPVVLEVLMCLASCRWGHGASTAREQQSSELAPAGGSGRDFVWCCAAFSAAPTSASLC